MGAFAVLCGPWVESLGHSLSEARTWKPLEADLSVPTFGGANERQRNWTAKLDLGPLRWTKSWPVRLLPHQIPHHPQDRGPLKSYPVVDRQLVFVSDGE